MPFLRKKKEKSKRNKPQHNEIKLKLYKLFNSKEMRIY
jgi:hypothetical protein